MGPGYCLIWADLALPVPQTAVIAALGIIYGSLIGGLLGSLGLITGGLLGYGLMLTAARRFAQRLTGPRSLHKMESWFDRGGGWADQPILALAVSSVLPILLLPIALYLMRRRAQ